MENTDSQFYDIKDFEGLYLINRLGEIKSNGFKIIDKNGIIWKKAAHIPAFSPNNYGYYRVNLIGKNNILKKYLIHRLVALTFIENFDNKPFINHIDGNKTNNYYKNLEWCTQSENMYHSHYILGKGIPHKPIEQYSLDDKLLRIWTGINEIRKVLGDTYSFAISTALKENRLISKKYKWKYGKM